MEKGIIIRSKTKRDGEHGYVHSIGQKWSGDAENNYVPVFKWTNYIALARVFKDKREVPKSLRGRAGITFVEVEKETFNHAVSVVRGKMIIRKGFSTFWDDKPLSLEDAKKEFLKEIDEEILNLEDRVTELYRDRIVILMDKRR